MSRVAVDRFLFGFCALSAIALSNVALAEVRFARIFSDGVVLQRDRPIQVWGWADPGAEVRVTFGDRSAKTLANDAGEWSVALDALPACDEGRRLEAATAEASVVVSDVLVGDVWHASGQSNMAMTVGESAQRLEQVKRDIAEASFPSIRFCRVEGDAAREPLDDLQTDVRWAPCDPTTVSGFSAAAFYFARDVHARLDVPIGIVDTSRGGTPIEPFIPLADFESHPTLRRERELGDRDDLDGIWRLRGGVRARDANWLAGRLFNSRLHPLNGFAARGLIWYQGESNSGTGEDPRDYRYKMKALVEGLRREFDEVDLPVYFVQLPGSGAGPGWPYLREEQRHAAELIPHSGMVVTIDLDGDDIHPANKVDVGKRLALWALGDAYGQDVVVSGPLFERQAVEGDELVLRFRHAEDGLMAAKKEGLDPPREMPDANLSGFEGLDDAGQWKNAVATIRGDSVVVALENGKVPVAVRYAFAPTPTHCNLYNRSGLPASPFCTLPQPLEFDPGLPE